MLEVKRTGSDDYGKYIKTLIAGDAGSGKTLISSTFPSPFYASAEGGLMSIADRNIPYADIKTSNDLLRVKSALDQPSNVREEMFGFPVETIVIDTIDEIQRILIKERLLVTKKEAFQMQDWGWLGEQMQAIIRGLRNLDMNVVMTCHLKQVVDEETGRVSYRPALSGAIGNEIASYVDLALVLETNTVTRVSGERAEKVRVRSLITVPDLSRTWIKDRSGKLPESIEVNFKDDFARIHEFIYGSLHLPDTVTLNIDDSAVAPRTEQTVAPLAPNPEIDVEPSAPIRAAKPPVKPVAKPVRAAKVTDIVTDAPAPSPPERNALPDGVVAVPHGYGTNAFCVKCGGEVEDETTSDMSRIRFRMVLDKKCFEEMKR